MSNIACNQIVENDVNRICEVVSLKEIAGKDVLLTGGTGVIGAYILATIRKANSYGGKKTTVYLVIHNKIPIFMEYVKKCDWIKIVKGDLTEISFCESLPKADVIIHAAGYGQPGRFMEDKLNTIRINTTVTDILLKKMKPEGKFLFISTSEIYSGSDRYPYTENEYGCTTPQHPRSCYIEGKRCGEALCMAYAEKGANVKIARVSLAYGPCFNLGDKRVIYDFIYKAGKGEIKLLDCGNAQRVYCYVSDTVEMLWDILLNGKEVVYNVGGISHTKILDLAKIIAKKIGVNVVVPNDETGLTDAPRVVYMDINKVKNEFKKVDFIGLEEGVCRTIDWYVEMYK